MGICNGSITICWDYWLYRNENHDYLASLHDYTSIADIRVNHFTRSDRMLLQIESIRKTETGFLCEFSDQGNRIFGTLSKFRLLPSFSFSHIVKDHQRALDVTTVLWVKNVPILYVNQSGNIYLVINTDNIIRVYSRFDDTFLVSYPSP